MKLCSFLNNKFKFCGINLFKIKYRKGGMYFFILEIPICRYRNPAVDLYCEFRQNQSFDQRALDRKIDTITVPLRHESPDLDSHKVAHLATKLYEMGGHTKCIRDTIKALSSAYDQKLFLSQKNSSEEYASQIYQTLDRLAGIEGIEENLLNPQKKAAELARKIMNFAPRVLFAYIHPDDIIGAMVLSLLRKSTDIRILFFNHASHFPVMGMNFAHVILEGMPSTKKITEEERHCGNCRIIGLQSLAKDETIYYPPEKIQELRRTIGAADNQYLTVSGGAAYKFFDSPDGSEYFTMISRLLNREKQLVHLLISNPKKDELELIDRIFKDRPEDRKRLKILPFQKNIDLYFQCADVFIDSFPVSSALTQIDLMRNKVASVVKINRQNPEFSFHEYQMPGYPYMFEQVSNMENAVLELLHHPEKRREVIQKNYEFWLDAYEESSVRKRLVKIIKGTVDSSSSAPNN